MKYGVLLADPPWQYDFAPTKSRRVENQYPTMKLTDICELPVADICADDAILFLWATAPKLLGALEVMAAWGFIYVTQAVWDKEIIGMGYYFRGQHEILLVGKRGHARPPAPGARTSSVIRERRTGHSKKPEKAYQIIEAMYPDLPKVELFARTARPGWDRWGNEAPAGLELIKLNENYSSVPSLDGRAGDPH